MTYQTSAERLADMLNITCRQRRMRLAEEGRGDVRTPPPVLFTIAISREAGADGHLVAQAVGERLGWPVYDRELVSLLAEQIGIGRNLLDDLDEKRASWLQECLQGLTSARTVSQGGYVRHLVETLRALAGQGQCVIVGRAGAQILPPASTLRVRLVAPRAYRVDVIQQRLGLSRTEAERWVDQTDRERCAFITDHFHADPADPRHYDLTLNTARLAVQGAARLVIKALHVLQVRPTIGGPAGSSPALQTA
jgi:hypothetical protein